MEGKRGESGVGSDLSFFSLFFGNVTCVQDIEEEADQFGNREKKKDKKWIVEWNQSPKQHPDPRSMG